MINQNTMDGDTRYLNKFNHPYNPTQMQFATQYNNKRVRDPESNKKPSLTIPDQSMTIREIMTRYAKGLPISGGRVPLYENEDGEEDFYPDIEHMDLADRQQFLEDSKKQIQEAQAEVKRREQRNKELTAKAAREQARQKEKDRQRIYDEIQKEKDDAAIRKRSNWQANASRKNDQEQQSED